ncbi:MAG TPA: arylsulfotransferase family protein [Acidimicrobiales bacterium]|nr:arylsulfotransferase family protein [Acidimicrobiales bacterium]
MEEGGRVDRRSLLVGGIKAGLGLGLGARSARRLISSHHRPRDEAPGPAPNEVGTEPLRPPNFSRYVTRPDLTPVGISVSATPQFLALGPTPGYIFCAPKNPLAANPGDERERPFPSGATPGLMILETSGDLVWFKPLPGGDEVPFNFRVQMYNGKPTLTWFQGSVIDAHGVGYYVLADDTYQQVGQVVSTGYPCDLHEFIITPEGTALHTAYDDASLRYDDVAVFIGHAQEVDIATNDLVFDWACYPEVGLDLSYARAGHSYFDYFHINSIDLWPGPERNLLISSRNTSAVYLVDRQADRVVWRLGGKQSDFSMGPGASFYYQHDARALADGSGLSLFDDASAPCPEQWASGKVLDLDMVAKTATLQHRFLHTDGEMNTPSQGNCQLLDDGSHVVGWGYRPYFSVYAPSSYGTLAAPLVLDGRFPDGAASYRSFLFDWVGNPPQSEMALVVRPAAVAGHFTAWVSWNGATEVVAWRVNGGPSPTALSPLVTGAKIGFETVIDLIGDGAVYFDADALDANGNVLGRTPQVTIS